MNIDTDFQFAFAEGIRDFWSNIDYLKTQISSQKGSDDFQTKKYYDPRKLMRRNNFQLLRC
jgi:fructose-bisphosphate aldolase class II